MAMFKQAGDDDVAVTDRLLSRIREESPGHWPYGLSRAHFDGGLYLISKQAGMEPVGFVGWQERQEGRKNIGYYSIGVLPEHRRKGYAKTAVSAILAEKSAGVDEVRAMVVPTNEPSKQLARSLAGVTLLEKAANAKAIAKNLAWVLGGAVTGGPGVDNFKHGEGKGLWENFAEAVDDPKRRHQMAWNSVIGAMSGGLAAHSSPKSAIALGLAIPGKDLLISGDRALHDLDINKINNAVDQASKPTAAVVPKSVIYGGLGLGAAGLGIAGLVTYLRHRTEKAKLEAARAGRIRVTLPTKNPGDSETTIDMPSSTFPMSQALESKLNRDTRRRLLEETRQRTRHRKPKDPNNPTEAEREEIELEKERAALDAEDFRKRASARLIGMFKSAGAASAVPSPPAQGTNPALRMSQEAQTAQQMAQGASTDANPQIMQAQQATAAAEQQAQQQVAQAQQQAQQESMQRDQAHQQELAKKDQEVFQARQEAEIQKTQIEKAKVEMELAKAKMEAAQEIEDNKKSMTDALSSSNDAAVNKMTKQRLARIRSMVSKVASTQPHSGSVNPSTPEGFLPRNDAAYGIPRAHAMLAPAVSAAPSRPAAGPPPIKSLQPSVAQKINDRGHEYQAMGGLATTHLYRTSYGKLGDAAYGYLARPFLMTPPRDATSDWAQLSPETMSRMPDAFDAMLRAGQQVIRAPQY